MRTAALLAAALAIGSGLSAASGAASAADGLVVMTPEKPRAGCEGSRARIYSECRDQREVFEEARALAAREGKALMVSAGAEWCIWCHVLSATLQGFVDDAAALEDETLEAQADALREATAARFVIVHIELDKAPGGTALLEEIGAAQHIGDWIPFPFGVDAQGRFVAPLGERSAETGGEAEKQSDADNTDEAPLGYDRRMLLDRVLALYDAIQAANR